MRRRLSLGVQLLVMQVVIVLTTLLVAGYLAVHLQGQQIRDTYVARVLTIARSVAELPAVREAYATDDPSVTLQPLAELVRESAGATFVVFTDNEGIRYSHPNEDQIGERVSTDPGIALAGNEFVGTETGSLGPSLRAQVPVRDTAGKIIRVVSVGVLESRISGDLANVVPTLAAWLAAAALLGVLGAAVVARLVRRRIFGLEPDQIGELLQARDAMLHSVREGVVAVDAGGRLALVNDEAARLLGLSEDCTGRPVDEVLDASLLPLARGGERVVDRLVLYGERLLVVNSTAAQAGGRDVGRVLTLRDRTELFDALRALDGQRSITDALRAQAHEFSNSLHVVSGLVELQRYDDAVQFIERLGVGTGLMHGVSLREIEDASIATVLVTKSALARERGVDLRLDPDCEVVDGAGDDVITILANLVDNAIDAAGSGGTIEVLVRHQIGDGTEISVCDDGPGVSAELRRHIFESGVSTKTPTPDHHGRGIGLALVARIVARRRGSVEIIDRPTGGTIFMVRLPPTADAAASTTAVATGAATAVWRS